MGAGDVPLALDGLERRVGPDVVAALQAPELRELIGRQDRAGHLEAARLVDRVGRRARQVRVGAVERALADELRRRLHVGAVVRAEVVLHEVVRQQLAVVAEAGRDEARPLRMALEAVVDAAAVGLAQRAEVARGLAGVDQLAALVEVGAHAEHGVLGAVGDLGVRERADHRLHRLVDRVLGQPVVAQVPDDRVEVAEHAEVVRHAVLVDVPHHRADPVGPQGVDVLRGVARGVGPGRVGRVDAPVVLVGEDEDAGVLVVADAVAEALAGDQPLRSFRPENQTSTRSPGRWPVTVPRYSAK